MRGDAVNEELERPVDSGPLTEENAGAVVYYCGEVYPLADDRVFTIGRDADLCIDENPYLHRRFLEITHSDDMWWIQNVGSRLAATVADSSGAMQARVGPGVRIPLVFDSVTVVFTAGPTTYEFDVEVHGTAFQTSSSQDLGAGEATVGEASFTPSQYLLILGLCEPWLTRAGSGSTDIPRNAEVARRLGWSITRFNRKLDNVSDKLDRMGVSGMRGEPGSLATYRRARLVEYAVTARLVKREDLHLLDEEYTRNTVGARTGRDVQ